MDCKPALPGSPEKRHNDGCNLRKQSEQRRGEKMSNQQLATAMFLLIPCCLLCGCAASQKVLKNSPTPDGSVTGFLARALARHDSAEHL